MTDILLLHPPAVKPSEPPLSLAVLLAACRKQNCSVVAIDANLEAYQYLLAAEQLAPYAGDSPTTAVHRALKHRQSALDLLHSPPASRSLARYSTAVRHLNQLLALYRGQLGKERLTLGDYQHGELSPFHPDDLQKLVDGKEQTLFRNYFRDRLIPHVTSLRPRLISLTINYLHQALPAFELAGLLKKALPGATLVAGGGLITSWQEPLRRQKLQLPPFDHLVFGPGESLLPALEKRPTGNSYYLADDTQLSFFPDFEFASLGDYFSPHPTLPISASRGCYWQNCLFCPEATAPTHPYAASNPRTFPDLLLELSHRYRVSHFHLTDNAIPVATLKQLAARRAELQDLTWFGFVRFEKVLGQADFVRQLAASGCRLLQLGLESGSQRVLDRLGKGICLNTAERILENLHAAGIASYVYIMLGTPGEEECDAELTRDFLEKHAERISFLNLSIMNLPHGSDLLSKPTAFGIETSPSPVKFSPLGLYQTFQPQSGWDRAAVRRFLTRRLLGSPKIRTIINRTPPVFTSNHASFFAGPYFAEERQTE